MRHWMHTALISKDGEKMSKSLGNLVFVDALRKEWEPAAIRLGDASGTTTAPSGRGTTS